MAAALQGDTMPNTLGYHLVKSGYGLWLPGDERGHWSDAWDDQIGYTQPHTLHDGDPVRQRMAEERMKHPPVTFTNQMIAVIADTVGELIKRSKGDLRASAAAIETTHMHLLLPYTGRDIENTAKWIADQTTKAVHRKTTHQGPVWCKGKWRTYIFDEEHWMATGEYIRRHNRRAGRPDNPYPWIKPL